MMVKGMMVKASPCDYCKAPERLCPYCEYGGHSIKAEFAGGISVADIATITGAIGSVEIIWNGQPVTRVPVGGVFGVRAVGVWAHNPGGGEWDIKLTAIEIPATGDVETVANLGTFPQEMINYGNQYFSQNIGTANFDLNDIPKLVMPNRDLRLRVRLWGYPFRSGTVAVPRSAW